MKAWKLVLSYQNGVEVTDLRAADFCGTAKQAQAVYQLLCSVWVPPVSLHMRLIEDPAPKPIAEMMQRDFQSGADQVRSGWKELIAARLRESVPPPLGEELAEAMLERELFGYRFTLPADRAVEVPREGR